MTAKPQRPTVSVTKNYRLFQRSPENRPVNLKTHKRLLDAMKKYGFLRCYPIVCERNGAKQLVVKDGQHRLDIAEKLALPVYYIIDDSAFDVAIVNSTPKTWLPKDYAEKYAANGNREYVLGLQFAESYRLPVATAFSLLAGNTSYTNIQPNFISGQFKSKDPDWAHLVAAIYQQLCAFTSDVRNKRCLEACMCVCRVAGFDSGRLLQGAKRCREKLVSYSTRDAYLEMLEHLYNFGRKELKPLKNEAIMVMRGRSVCPK